MNETTGFMRFSVSDAPLLTDLSGSIGWPHAEAQWREMLSSENAVFYGRKQDGRAVSSTGMFSYGAIASLAMVLVRPEYRGRGFASEAIKACLARFAAGMPVMLAATEYGYPVYKKFGFKTVSSLRRLSGRPNINDIASARTIRRAESADKNAVFSFDAVAFGADRRAVLGPFLRNCFIAEHEGKLCGFSCVRGAAVGPLAATDTDTALALFFAAARQAQGSGIFIDVPSPQQEFINALERLGMRETASLPVMLLNAGNLPGDRTRLFAFASRALG